MLLSLMGSYLDLFRGRGLLLGLGPKAREGEEGAEAALLEELAQSLVGFVLPVCGICLPRPKGCLLGFRCGGRARDRSSLLFHARRGCGGVLRRCSDSCGPPKMEGLREIGAGGEGGGAEQLPRRRKSLPPAGPAAPRRQAEEGSHVSPPEGWCSRGAFGRATRRWPPSGRPRSGRRDAPGRHRSSSPPCRQAISAHGPMWRMSRGLSGLGIRC